MIDTSYGPVDEIKFWSKVRVSSADQCWEWLGSKDGKGYGRFWVAAKGKLFTAHRIAFELFFQTMIPDDLFACHHCDNKVCCNPHHVFLGTQKDNMQDASAKGRIIIKNPARGLANGSYTRPERRRVGETNGNSKLTHNIVLAMRNSPDSYVFLARKYGVSRKTARFAKLGLTWKPVPRGPGRIVGDPEKKRGARHDY